MYILIFLEYGGRLLIGHWKPVTTTATPPGEIGNYLMVPLSVLLLLISLAKPGKNVSAA